MVKLSTMVASMVLGFVVMGWTAPKAVPNQEQEREQRDEQRSERRDKRVRVRVGKNPCVFVSSGHKRGTLGVQLTDLTSELRAHFGAPAATGVMVSKVVSDSPAEKAGFQVGDVITAVDGEEVSSSNEVSRRIRRKGDGEVSTLQVYRDKGLMTLDATIEARERSEVDLGGMFVDCEELEGLESLEELEELEDFDFQFEFDEEQIRESVERATEYLRSPEFRSQWEWVERWDEDELEEKLEEMEEKLEKMEKELKKLEKEKDKKKKKI